MPRTYTRKPKFDDAQSARVMAHALLPGLEMALNVIQEQIERVRSLLGVNPQIEIEEDEEVSLPPPKKYQRSPEQAEKNRQYMKKYHARRTARQGSTPGRRRAAATGGAALQKLQKEYNALGGKGVASKAKLEALKAEGKKATFSRKGLAALRKTAQTARAARAKLIREYKQLGGTGSMSKVKLEALRAAQGQS